MTIKILQKIKYFKFKYKGKWIGNNTFNIHPYLQLIRIDKPIGTWLLFWPSAWSLTLSTSLSNKSSPYGPQPAPDLTRAWNLVPENGGIWDQFLSLHLNVPDTRLVLIFLAGAFVMRNSGCIINDMWDKDYDGLVERTKGRPLAQGILTRSQALKFLAINLIASLALLLQLDTYTIVLGFLALIPTVTYPLSKRFFPWPQLHLGITFNWGCLMGWSAIMGSLEPVLPITLISISSITWTILYDTIYAHQDKIYDGHLKLNSTALYFGDESKTFLRSLALTMYTSLLALGPLTDRAFPYYLALAASTIYTFKGIHSLDIHNPKACGDTFVRNKNIGWIMFLGFLLS